MHKNLRVSGILGLFLLAASACLSTGAVADTSIQPTFWSLCYHDVRDDVDGDLDADEMAVSSAHLLQHFEWLRVNGYQPIRLEDIARARRGGKPLPNKPILLSFDDGYASFYHKVYPLLKLYQYPAVLSVVTAWLEVPEGEFVVYGETLRPREDFLTWSQIAEMRQSGWVDIASHTHDLHQAVVANPQGNRLAAAVTRRFDVTAQRYESDADFQSRIRDDLQFSQTVIQQRLNLSSEDRVRAITWPYGQYSQEVYEIASDLGMTASLVLSEQENSLESPHIHRMLITKNPPLDTFKYLLGEADQVAPRRVVHVDLDYVYDADLKQQQRNLDQLLDRIKLMRVNTVFLQAFADPDGDGSADALYFPNQVLPVRADLFSRVAWQLHTRAMVDVYAWMPVSAFVLNSKDYPQYGLMQVWSDRSGEIKVADADYHRLSVFQPQARALIQQIYTDLAKYTPFQGILFHDDAYLSDFEDLNPAAVRYYQQKGWADFSLAAIRKDPEAQQRFSQLKTQGLIEFTQTLVDTLHYYRPGIKSARNLYAQPVLNPKSEVWFAQSLDAFLKAYDYTAVMAMPYMEGASDADQAQSWLKHLVAQVMRTEDLQKIIFELQSVDWKTQTPIATQELVTQMQNLQRQGALSFGYYPDDFLNNHPALHQVRAGISLEDYPYERK